MVTRVANPKLGTAVAVPGFRRITAALFLCGLATFGAPCAVQSPLRAVHTLPGRNADVD